MIKEIDFHIFELDCMKKYPNRLFFKGNTELLKRRKISIVGSRKPNQYAREKTQELASKLSQAGICIVSGGAIGVDAISHKAAGIDNTIVVSPAGLDTIYPKINAKLIQRVEESGLVLSQFEEASKINKYNFVLRNEVVVALGDILIVTYADLNSGSMRSVEYALKMGKEVYVFAHRIGESEATNKLLSEGKAKAIYDIDEFVSQFKSEETKDSNSSEFLDFCKSNPTYDEVVKKFPSEVFEAELNGTIDIVNARVQLNL